MGRGHALLQLDDLADGLLVIEGAVLVSQGATLVQRDPDTGLGRGHIASSVSALDDGVRGGDERERESDERGLGEHG